MTIVRSTAEVSALQRATGTMPRQRSTPTPLDRPRSFQATARAGLLVAAFATTLGVTTLTPPDAAEAATVGQCVAGDLYVNVGNGVLALDRYTTTGVLVSTVPLSKPYGDIAFSNTGSTLYGAEWNASNLDTIDPATGAATASITIAGPAAGGSVNALSALPDGSLLAGVAGDSALYTIDPATGVSVAFRAALPSGYTPAGDFISLTDGDILVAAVDAGGVGYLMRIHPDNTTTIVGTVPESFGAAQTGGSVFLVTATGDIDQVITVPTAASTAPVATTSVAVTGEELWGAASQQDAGLCAPTLTAGNPPVAASGTPYSYTLPASGSPAPTFAVTGGQLPPGIVLDPTTGQLSGSASAVGSWTFTITVTNLVGSDSQAFTIQSVASNTPNSAQSDAGGSPASKTLAASGMESGAMGLLGGATGMLVLSGFALIHISRRRGRQVTLRASGDG